MKVQAWPIDRVVPYEKNPRNNDAAVDAVAASIREFGFRVPIVVDGSGVIIAGHTRLKAAQKLGLAQVPVHMAAELSEDQVRALLLHDLVQKADELQAQLELLPLDPAGKKRLLRRHAQAAAASNQEDEVLVGAYQACLSYREAAKVLSARLKTKITKDKVKRAVDRAGGPAVVINGANSNSVVRTVASHRRDKGGRF